VQAETFQNTTIIVVMDVAHQPRDAAVVDKVCSGRHRSDSFVDTWQQQQQQQQPLHSTNSSSSSSSLCTAPTAAAAAAAPAQHQQQCVLHA
jgi:hypothetical protein